jgi:hypothetical protein
VNVRERLDEFEGCFAMTAVPSFAANPIAALRAVLDLHSEFCMGCDQDWPCSTVRVIEDKLK